MAPRGDWIRFEPDHRGIGRMLDGPEFGLMVKDFADHGMRYAQSISQVDSAEYVNSFEVIGGLHAVIDGSRRAMAELWNTADHAAAVEWGHDHRVLGRTVDEIEQVQLG